MTPWQILGWYALWWALSRTAFYIITAIVDPDGLNYDIAPDFMVNMPIVGDTCMLIMAFMFFGSAVRWTTHKIMRRQ
jgi:hypothetical protein